MFHITISTRTFLTINSLALASNAPSLLTPWETSLGISTKYFGSITALYKAWSEVRGCSLFSRDLFLSKRAVSLNSKGEALINGPRSKSLITSLLLGSRLPKANCPAIPKQSSNTRAAGSFANGKSSA